MPKKTETAELPFSSSQYSTLEDYLGAVRKLLQTRQELNAKWIEGLLEGEAIYLQKCFEKQEHPAAAALEVFITEEESAREPVQADCRLKIDVSEQGRGHLKGLVELGLWGDSVEAVAKALVEQSLAAKLESGLLRTTYSSDKLLRRNSVWPHLVRCAHRRSCRQGARKNRAPYRGKDPGSAGPDSAKKGYCWHCQRGDAGVGCGRGWSIQCSTIE